MLEIIHDDDIELRKVNINDLFRTWGPGTCGFVTSPLYITKHSQVRLKRVVMGEYGLMTMTMVSWCADPDEP